MAQIKAIISFYWQVIIMSSKAKTKCKKVEILTLQQESGKSVKNCPRVSLMCPSESLRRGLISSGCDIYWWLVWDANADGIFICGSLSWLPPWSQNRQTALPYLSNRPILVYLLSPAHLRYRMTTSVPRTKDRTNKPHSPHQN